MSGTVFTESDPFSPIKYGYTIDTMIYSHQGPFGEIAIANSAYFGRMLILDGVVQLTERDEHFYHEMLVHVPLFTHPDPKRVLIIGGGDGGTLREVLKHEGVTKVVMAEIDRGVIDASIKYLPTLSSGFNDPRVKLEITDGAKLAARERNAFDVVLVDCTDPVGPALSLFSEQFFADVHTALRADGIYVCQTESLHFHLDFIRGVQSKLKLNFKHVDLYTVSIATYAGNWWSFSIGSKGIDPRKSKLRPAAGLTTKYYARDVHRAAFLPLSLRKRLLD